MFFSADDDPDDAPTAGDGVLICMSVLARDEELLVERNDAAHLSLPKYLLIFLLARVWDFESTEPDFSNCIYSLGASVGLRDGDPDGCTGFS